MYKYMDIYQIYRYVIKVYQICIYIYICIVMYCYQLLDIVIPSLRRTRLRATKSVRTRLRRARLRATVSSPGQHLSDAALVLAFAQAYDLI